MINNQLNKYYYEKVNKKTSKQHFRWIGMQKWRLLLPWKFLLLH